MIIAITDRKISAMRDFIEQLEAVAASAPDMIILREKDLSEPEYKYLAIECQRICGYHSIKFCVNTFIKTAVSANDGRIQVSYGSLVANIDKLKSFEELWVSVHSLKEAVEAEKMGATHLIYGNVYETSCKPGVEGKGLQELREVCDTVRLPVFGVGGIDLLTAKKVMDAGCKGICVRSLLMQTADPRSTMEELKRRIGKE